MKLHTDVTLQISPADLCSILSELICKDYSLFEGLVVAEIDQRKDGNFDVALVSKPKLVDGNEPAEGEDGEELAS